MNPDQEQAREAAWVEWWYPRESPDFEVVLPAIFAAGFDAGADWQRAQDKAECDATILALREALQSRHCRHSFGPCPYDAVLANTEAAARQAKLRVIREFVKKCENAGSPHLYAADRAWAFRDTARHELVALEQEQAK